MNRHTFIGLRGDFWGKWVLRTSSNCLQDIKWRRPCAKCLRAATTNSHKQQEGNKGSHNYHDAASMRKTQTKAKDQKYFLPHAPFEPVIDGSLFLSDLSVCVCVCVFVLNDCRRLLLTSVACFEYVPAYVYTHKYVLSTCRLMTKPSEFQVLQVLCLSAQSNVDCRTWGLGISCNGSVLWGAHTLDLHVKGTKPPLNGSLSVNGPRLISGCLGKVYCYEKHN